ncbi:MFS transporter [Domibacillus epiphyticus]|uniref:MFS transporter n=1 Tax=Domibacillus epiphyticus TaxID=1714355 RepID=A0A1V2A675_9BACI|nr:aromatic acid/H+ symport family MFS transporter [Domibacillus epiphyticus]OMP66503.1 MFS transporter [Domibacillus epiphyticus]
MRSINMIKTIDDSKFNSFQASILFWCGFIIAFDGYDLVIYGSVVPALIEEWSLTPTQAGTLGSYALVGMMMGALIFGPLADKIGRKKVILFCVAMFSIFTGIAGFASGPAEFGIYRFIAGLGLGGVMPNTVALMTEYSPKSLKNTLVTIMFSGYSVGGMLSAGLAIYLIPDFGWQSIFFVGAIPLLFLPIMYKTLPESPNFLLMKKDEKQVRKVLSKIDPMYQYKQGDHFEGANQKQEGIPIVSLFKERRALSTVMIWIAFFMCLLMIYGLNTWLPKLMVEAGYPISSSLIFLLLLNFGAIFGAVFGGWMADRWGAKRILILFFITGALSLSMLGFKAPILILYTLVAIAGASTIGTQIIANAYVSQYYPTEMRSSGVGWALGVGRTGAIIGPIMGGVLLTMSLPTFQNFLVFAIPGVIGAICIMVVQEKYSSSAKSARAAENAEIPALQRETKI